MIVNLKPGPDIYSAGDAQVRNHSNLLTSNDIWVDHKIWVAPLNGLDYEYDQSNKTGSGSVISILRKPATSDTCFRATLSVSAYHSAYQSDLTKSYSTSPPNPCTPEEIDKPNGASPIVVDLNLNGIHLSGLEPPVYFDLDLDGSPEATAWTRKNTGDGFLCRDRNEDGEITNVDELFGNWTTLEIGVPAEVGYLALQELDQPEYGGNRVRRGGPRRGV